MMKNIMLIDDDVIIRKTLDMLIRQNHLGRVVGELSTGAGAVEEILSCEPDIVLVDLLLPVLDGIRIVAAAREAGCAAKFVMISQVEDQELIARAYESGIQFYIGKPINIIEAVNVIRNVSSTIDLEQSLAQIRTAVLQVEPPARRREDGLEERITAIFTDIGIVGAVGSAELRGLLRLAREHGDVPLADLYDLLLEESGKGGPAAKKALEQRIRRTVQKALTTLAEIGCNDYANSIFMDYSTLLFDFRQVRQEMRHIASAGEEPGKINTKKFLAGLLTKLSP